MSRPWGNTATFDTAPLRRRAELLAMRHRVNHGGQGRRMSDAGLRDFVLALGLHPTYFYRERLTWPIIDRYCIALGCHPLELYPDFCDEGAA